MKLTSSLKYEVDRMFAILSQYSVVGDIYMQIEEIRKDDDVNRMISTKIPLHIIDFTGI
jgi:hypothetical protein